ncbi:RNA-guided endonuclease IscB [Desulfallas sp. Bu1-1]|uniref:RNA-guided endonuclease IscB n=1 Tax=Desulfallas sp. Bu1-1 TaxID=2787620 RepID=UPI002435EC55|nr:RNA-guided endonuclease IscB [Desulfallas sp. Bu1-1]
MYVFVLSKTGKRLMPTHAAKARKLLKAKKAKIVSRNPFTIQLTYETAEYTQKLAAKLDTGFKRGGVALQSNSKITFQGEIVHRRYINQPTKGQVLVVRRQRRRARRYRLRYRAPRFANRRRPEGWLPPTIKAKADAQINVLKVLAKYAPVTKAIIEVGSFDTHKMQNPDIKPEDYQNGRQKGFKNVKEYVKCRDKHCIHCGAEIEEVHHLKQKVKGGTDNPDNLVALCGKCHRLVTLGKLKLSIAPSKELKGAAFINAAKDYIVSEVKKFIPEVVTQEGWQTKEERERLNLPKSHVNNAIAMGTSGQSIYVPDIPVYEIRPRQRAVRQQYMSEPKKGGIFKRYRHPWQSTAGIKRGDLCRDVKTGQLVRADTLLANGKLNVRVLKTGQRLVNATPNRLQIVERAKGLMFIPRKEAEPALLP